MNKCIQFWSGLAVLSGCILATATSGQTNQLAETWLDPPGHYPAKVRGEFLPKLHFPRLAAEVLAGKLKVTWQPPASFSNSTVSLFASADAPGHWPARDWRAYPMERRGLAFETYVPVDNLDVPLIYFVQIGSGALAQVSPMRLCKPRTLGLEEPTRIFWPFVEGFEEGTESWRWLAGGAEATSVTLSTTAKNGRASLSVEVPAGRTSVTVGTTRIRGWQLDHYGAKGVSLWVRASESTGQARFTFMANAFSSNQVVGVTTNQFAVGKQWQRIDLPFSKFSRFPIGDIDLFAIQLTASAGAKFLVDDLQLLGRWALHDF